MKKKVKDIWISLDVYGCCLWNKKPVWDKVYGFYKFKTKAKSNVGCYIPDGILEHIKDLKMNSCRKVVL